MVFMILSFLIINFWNIEPKKAQHNVAIKPVNAIATENTASAKADL